MAFDQIKANDKLVKRIRKGIMTDAISHAYIFEGESCVDKRLAATTFAKAILCENRFKLEGNCCEACASCRKIDHENHEDLIVITKEGNHIKDEAIENLQSRLKKKPYVGDRTIAIIEDGDTMTLRAQNRLLKTLEEPPVGAVILLISENVENLTQTIRSRCILYRFHPFYTERFESVLSAAKQIERMLLEKAPFFNIEKELAAYSSDQQSALLLLDTLESWYRDIGIVEYDERGELLFHQEQWEEIKRKSRLYKRERIDKAISCIEEARNDINRNIKISYVLKNMVLKMEG